MNLELEKILIYPLGGISKFKMPLNISIKKEAFVLIMGPVFQIIAGKILIVLMPNYIDIINKYNYGIIIFNMLPIFPLDGGKLTNLLLSKIFPYKKSLKYTIILSYITVIFIFVLNIKYLNINIIVMTIFLIYKIHSEKKNMPIVFEKFLLERYLNNIEFENKKIVKDVSEFYRENTHLIYKNDKYYIEKEYLNKFFEKRIDIKKNAML